MQYTNCNFCSNNDKECRIKEEFEAAAADLKGKPGNGYFELNCLGFKNNLTLAKNLVDQIIQEQNLNPTQSEVREAIEQVFSCLATADLEQDKGQIII